MVQPGQGQCPAEPAALLGGIDADHVDLAEPSAGPRLGRVHLRPVKAGHDAVFVRDEEARRVEPRLPLAQVQVVPGPAALLGVLGERPGVERQPLVLVLAGHEGAQRTAGWEGRPGQRIAR